MDIIQAIRGKLILQLRIIMVKMQGRGESTKLDLGSNTS